MLVATLMVMSCAASQKSNGKKESAILNEIDKVHRDMFRWMIAKQMDSLDQVLHKDMRYIHSNGWTETKEEVLANIQSGKLAYHKVEIGQSHVRLEGSTGIVIGKGLFSVSLEGTPIDIHLLYTEVFVKTKHGWKCISRHACKV